MLSSMNMPDGVQVFHNSFLGGYILLWFIRKASVICIAHLTLFLRKFKLCLFKINKGCFNLSENVFVI